MFYTNSRCVDFFFFIRQENCFLKDDQTPKKEMHVTSLYSFQLFIILKWEFSPQIFTYIL